MTNYTEGTVLTCTHEECSCRILIQTECHCPEVTDESTYLCACGAELVPVEAAEDKDQDAR